jgi:putative membrane protein
VLTAAILLIHLVAFAAFLGAGFAQTQMMKVSARPGTAPETRDVYERLAAGISTKIEVPAIFTSIASGVVFITQNPAFMKQGWLHGKLLCVLLLAVLSHLEMFNARNIVKARAAGGPGADAEIAKRKARHVVFGRIGGLLVLAILVFVTFVRLG